MSSLSGLLQTDSSAFDSESEVIEAPSSDLTPDAKVCPTCDAEIIREPGTRGRLPKYHPQCRPTAVERLTGARKSPVRDAKKGREADEAVAMFKAMFVKVAIGVSMVDRYDGFCIMAALPEACNNLRGVLIAHDSFRRDVLAIKSGGSILGLIFSGLMMVVPMLAHHGLIPSPQIAALLTNLPVTMYKVQKQLAQGEEHLTAMLDDMAAKASAPDKRDKDAA